MTQDQAGLDFDEVALASRRTANRLFWNVNAGLIIAILLMTAFLATLLNAGYRLAHARHGHWPNSLPRVAMANNEVDPLLKAMTEKGCRAEPDFLPIPCQVAIATLTMDGAALNSSLSSLTDVAEERSNWINDALGEAIIDAASRADWATCVGAARSLLRLNEALARGPLDVTPESNRLLLLGTICQDARALFKHPKLYARLINAVGEGQHLDGDLISALQQQGASDASYAWSKYFTGLIALRDEKFDLARANFGAAEFAGGSVRELAMLGAARSIFWKLKKRPKIEEANLQELREIAGKMKKGGLRNDVEYYISELKK